jgi:hypothetical protein
VPAAKEQRDMSKHSNVHGYSQAGDWLIGTARRNPEALLLLAAGCALLMRTRGSSRSAIEQQAYVSHSAEDHASNLGNKVSKMAGEYAESVSGFVQEASRNVAQQSDRFRRKAQTTVEGGMKRVLREQPLAVALAGLAAGAAVAAAFPRTELENRTLGPAHDALTKAAAKAGENLMGAAADRLQTGAAEAVKNLVGDVTGTFASDNLGPNAPRADDNVELRGKDT